MVIDAETTFIAPFDEEEVHVINEYDGDGEGIMTDSSNRGQPADTVETLRRKSRNRCKVISLLQQQITLLQNELAAIKDKSIARCLLELIERAGQWKELSRMPNRKLTISAQTYMRVKIMLVWRKYRIQFAMLCTCILVCISMWLP